MPVSCFQFSVSLLHAIQFWEMTSLLCWKFTLVYRVHIHYAMATILVACVLQSLQNSNKQLYQLHQSWFQCFNTLVCMLFTRSGAGLVCSSHGSLWCMVFTNVLVGHTPFITVNWIRYCTLLHSICIQQLYSSSYSLKCPYNCQYISSNSKKNHSPYYYLN